MYVDNMQIFRQKFNAVPELQALKLTYPTQFSGIYCYYSTRKLILIYPSVEGRRLS